MHKMRKRQKAESGQGVHVLEWEGWFSGKRQEKRLYFS